jgi:hypothetical protein
MTELDYLKMICITERNYDPVAINIWNKIKMDEPFVKPWDVNAVK